MQSPFVNLGVLNTGSPFIVCLGGMKNFARFNDWLHDQKDEDLTEFFKKTVALIMLWNESVRIVGRQKFGGYRHKIATYTLSWLYELTDLRIDLEKIWFEQKVGDLIKDKIEQLSIIVNEHIRDTKLDVGEWCKKEECWQKLKECDAPELSELKTCLITGKVSRPKPAKGNDAIEFCKSQGSAAWKELSKWLKDMNFMSGKQRSQCFNMGKFLHQNREPSVILATVCRDIWKKAEDSYGWKPSSEHNDEL